MVKHPSKQCDSAQTTCWEQTQPVPAPSVGNRLGERELRRQGPAPMVHRVKPKRLGLSLASVCLMTAAAPVSSAWTHCLQWDVEVWVPVLAKVLPYHGNYFSRSINNLLLKRLSFLFEIELFPAQDAGTSYQTVL